LRSAIQKVKAHTVVVFDQGNVPSPVGIVFDSLYFAFQILHFSFEVHESVESLDSAAAMPTGYLASLVTSSRFPQTRSEQLEWSMLIDISPIDGDSEPLTISDGLPVLKA